MAVKVINWAAMRLGQGKVRVNITELVIPHCHATIIKNGVGLFVLYLM